MILKYLKTYLMLVFNTRAAGLYILCFAISIGVATFIENDFGTSAAQKVVYQSWWFTVLLLLFGISILVNIIKFRMISQRKYALLLFHAAIIIIIMGAGLTRYLGFEGVMHIRENSTSNEFLSSETYLQFAVSDGNNQYQFDEEVLFTSLGSNQWEESYQLGNRLLDFKVKEFIPNHIQTLQDDVDGGAILKIVLGGTNGREEYFLTEGRQKRIHNTLFNFSPQEMPGAINIILKDGVPYLKNDQPMTRMIMASQTRDTIPANNQWSPLTLRALYSTDRDRFVFGDFRENGSILLASADQKVRKDSRTAVKMEATVNGVAQEFVVYGQKGIPGRPARLQFDDFSVSVAYGAKNIALPFSIKLYDFIMERYPGTDNAASYASEVQLIDSKNNVQKDYRIYMNNILNHQGYRFFQSSFDRDEKGTYLSVNHDWWGTWVSYFGYFLLTAGMVLTLFSKHSRFYQVRQQITKMRKAALTILLLIGCTQVNAQKVIDQRHSTQVIDKVHAEQFSKVVVQDFRGRMKPVHTLSREILRKVSRKEQIAGLSADQVILGMFTNRRDWLHVPLIKVGKHEDIRRKIGIGTGLAKYSDFFAKDGSYKLREEVRAAFRKEQAARGTYEKELLKLDERVNILNMVFSGRLFRLIPIKGDPNNTWVAASNHQGHSHDAQAHNDISEKFFTAYRTALSNAIKSGDYRKPNQLLAELSTYQRENGQAVMPSSVQLNLEILLNQWKIFNRLGLIYALLGLAFLTTLFISVFRPKAKLKITYKVLFGLVVAAFLLHTGGLAIRWYVSERAPWSNGYESMIYIAWTTTLAGVIFTRKSYGGLAATMVLAATVLLVALLSHMDPEITPLVPVLKSYWLTIHVSLEAGSYGFLMLGAVIGIINLILFICLTRTNKERVNRIIKEMSYLSELTLIGGLVMISTGTYLGGIWANESWGRYWGWDAKETWALVTILIYAFILHMRIIPKLYGLFAYNLSTIFGLASVIMTYYGVNYYLSGLHSYAAGDPVPIPTWVYMMVAWIVVVSVAAYVQHRKHNLSTQKVPKSKAQELIKPQLNHS